MHKIILLPLSIVSAVLIGGITLVTLFSGSLRENTPVIVEAGDCRLPCWNGITPGKTILRQAVEILSGQGYKQFTEPDAIAVPGQQLYLAPERGTVCRVGLTRTRMAEAVVREVALWFCDPPAVGRLVATLGAPQTIFPLTSLLVYGEGQIVLIMAAPLCGNTFSPRSPVRSISLADSTFNRVLFTQPVKLPWRGFMPMWRYGQLAAGEQRVC